MIRSLYSVEIFLKPGDHCFVDRSTRICTLLGACVSMTFWHPQLLVGGMCHYMLPERGSERREGDWPAPDGRYADEAIALLLKKINVVGASHREYQVKLFGGNMFPKMQKNISPQIGILNVQAARRLVKQHGFTCMDEHFGDIGYQNVVFDVWSGEVLVKRCNELPAVTNWSLG